MNKHDDMSMPIDKENYVVIDEERFESAQCQETDYNFDDVIYDSVTFKSKNIIRDFEIDGLLTLAFPLIFSNA